MHKVKLIFLSGYFWGVVSGIVGIAGLFFSSYQFYSAAALTERLYKGQLALEAHERTYKFIAIFTDNYQVVKDKNGKPIKATENFIPKIPTAIRVSAIEADGAIFRASIIDQKDIRACLYRMFTIHNDLLEGTIPSNHEISLLEYALDLDDFPKMVDFYISGKSIPDKYKGELIDKNNDQISCKVIRDDAELGLLN